MKNATGAQRVLGAAKGLAAEDRTGFELALGQVEFALGQRDAAGADVQATAVEPSTEPGSAGGEGQVDGDGARRR